MPASSRTAGQTAVRWLIAIVATILLVRVLPGELLAKRGLKALVLAVVLNFFLCGWILFVFALIQPDLRHPRLAAYFRPQPWERAGRFYLRLGVLRFQSLISKYMPGKPPPGRDVRTNRTFLADMELATRNAEVAHALCFLALLPFIVGAARLGNASGTAWLVVNGLAWHVYPVFLQRYNRPRWQRLLAALDRATPPPNQSFSFS